jgi:hypothetical protein
VLQFVSNELEFKFIDPNKSVFNSIIPYFIKSITMYLLVKYEINHRCKR